MHPNRPGTDEYDATLAPAFASYIERVPNGDLVSLLRTQCDTMRTCLTPLSRKQLLTRPTPVDWNLLEVLGHITDTEQIFAYRVLRIARGDATPLASFEQDDYVRAAHFADRTLEDLLAIYTAVRQTSIALFATLDAEAWQRRGTVAGIPSSARAWAYAAVGHELHHFTDFTTLYGLAANDCS